MAEPKIIVQKYGGSSVSDVNKLKQVAMHIADTTRKGLRVVVVVSAMGKTTDELIGMAQGICRAPSRRELDMLLSTGERISMALLAMALSELGIDAISFTGSQSGILTNDRHSGARIIEVRPIRIEDELARGKVVIVAGFQGMSYKREITTLGRGGSDTTAVALAAALGADACEIYSDVDGVYTADPRIVPDARRLPEISYEDMQELAEHGAKVLNAQAVEWAKKTGIVIHARKTGYVDGAPETLVVGQVRHRPTWQSLATAVTGSKAIVKLVCHDQGPEALSFLAQEGVPLRQSRLYRHDTGIGLCASFVRDDLPDFPNIVGRLQALHFPTELDQNLGMVTAVGAGLGSQAELISKAVAALQARGCLVEHMDSSPLRLCVWMPTEQIERGIQAMHEFLIG